MPKPMHMETRPQREPSGRRSHFIGQLGGQLGAGASQGVAQSDGPAVDVGDVQVQAQLAHAVGGLGAEGLVQLEKVSGRPP